ncbi:hypothetical protein [Burkholderia pseudomallei]|uniref:hypothetical protein n=1 Tax=Burkholderia pseudomallei TaxID=28450 RepID=UPI0009B2932B|nr:hypothetical protein [Burkholderia pseudomallei]
MGRCGAGVGVAPSPIAHRPSPIAHRPSPIAHRPSHIAHRTSHIAHRTSHIAHRTCRFSIRLAHHAASKEGLHRIVSSGSPLSGFEPLRAMRVHARRRTAAGNHVISPGTRRACGD